MQTINKTAVPNEVVMADWTINGCPVGISINNPIFYSYGFVINKALELSESPLMHPFVVSASSSDVYQVFHNYSCSCWNAIDDSLAYVMVSPSHKPRPPATQPSQVFFGRFCAFSLELTNQPFMFDSETLNLLSEEELVGCYGKIVYADINSKNSILEVRAFGIDIFSEIEKKETSAFSVNSQQAFFDLPTEIIFVTFRNVEWNFNSSFDCAYAKNVVLEGSGTGKIITNGNIIDTRFGFSPFDHLTGLSATANDELCLEPGFFEIFIDGILEFELVPDFVLPSVINTIPQGFTINLNSPDNFRGCFDFDFSSCSNFHSKEEEQQIYKCFENVEVRCKMAKKK